MQTNIQKKQNIYNFIQQEKLEKVYDVGLDFKSEVLDKKYGYSILPNFLFNLQNKSQKKLNAQEVIIILSLINNSKYNTITQLHNRTNLNIKTIKKILNKLYHFQLIEIGVTAKKCGGLVIKLQKLDNFLLFSQMSKNIFKEELKLIENEVDKLLILQKNEIILLKNQNKMQKNKENIYLDNKQS